MFVGRILSQAFSLANVTHNDTVATFSGAGGSQSKSTGLGFLA